jgi:Protein of unknown function (DUF664)
VLRISAAVMGYEAWRHEVGVHPDFRDAVASLRWIMLHMIEETARHAGHMDAIRELLDGSKGYY